MRIRICVAMLMATMLFCATPAVAEPPAGDVPPPPLPDVVLTASDWQPQFPFPFSKMRHHITEADINAQREMCQWFNPQYRRLKIQIEDLNNVVIRNNGRFDAPGVPAYAAAVTANIDKSLAFLGPRVHALTRKQNHAGDIYFPLYQGESFFRLWEQLSNVSNGIKARQPTWFVGPSFHHAQRFGSKIERSHVCG